MGDLGDSDYDRIRRGMERFDYALDIFKKIYKSNENMLEQLDWFEDKLKDLYFLGEEEILAMI